MAPFAPGLAVGLMLAQAPAQVPRPDPAALKAKVARALPLVRTMAADPTVVSAVVAQNARQLSLEAIRKVDQEWMATRGVNDLIKKHLESPCARALKAFAAKHPAVAEAFAMDAQGALVCSIAKTTDYWQGDEPKWQRAFGGGRGAEVVDSPQFDDSSLGYCIQVSVPVKERDKVVGVIAVGFALDRLESRPDGKPEAKRRP